MKSSCVILLPVMIVSSVHADVLSQLNPFLNYSRVDYYPASIESVSAMENPGYAPFSPADSDLGVQQVLGSYHGLPPVTVLFDTSVSYTTNAPKAISSGSEGSWYSASQLNVSWLPRIAYGWFADIGLDQELYRFEGSNTVDFEYFQPYVGVVKSIPELDDLIFFYRYKCQRLTTGTLSESDDGTHSIQTGLQKNLLLTSTYQLAARVDASFDINSSAQALLHNKYTADLSYTYWFADKLSATLSWTGALWDYRNGGRQDWSNVVGLELTWRPCQNARIYTNIFYTNLNSNLASGTNDFEAFEAGIGLGLNYSF